MIVEERKEAKKKRCMEREKARRTKYAVNGDVARAKSALFGEGSRIKELAMVSIMEETKDAMRKPEAKMYFEMPTTSAGSDTKAKSGGRFRRVDTDDGYYFTKN